MKIPPAPRPPLPLSPYPDYRTVHWADAIPNTIVYVVPVVAKTLGALKPYILVDAEYRLLREPGQTYTIDSKVPFLFVRHGPLIACGYDTDGVHQVYTDIPAEVVMLQKDTLNRSVTRPRPLVQMPVGQLTKLSSAPQPPGFDKLSGVWDVVDTTRVVDEYSKSFTIDNRLAATALAAELIRVNCKFQVSPVDHAWTFHMNDAAFHFVRTRLESLLGEEPNVRP